MHRRHCLLVHQWELQCCHRFFTHHHTCQYLLQAADQEEGDDRCMSDLFCWYIVSIFSSEGEVKLMETRTDLEQHHHHLDLENIDFESGFEGY